jgi:hypothetical protein
MTYQKIIGDIGEELVAAHFDAILSPNKFDTACDMRLADGTSIEVKTQFPYTPKTGPKLATVSLNQLKKCLTVDKLIFVLFDETDVIAGYECSAHPSIRTDFVTYTTKFGKTMIGWPVNRMNRIFRIIDPVKAKLLQTHTQSGILKKLIALTEREKDNL